MTNYTLHTCHVINPALSTVVLLAYLWHLPLLPVICILSLVMTFALLLLTYVTVDWLFNHNIYILCYSSLYFYTYYQPGVFLLVTCQNFTYIYIFIRTYKNIYYKSIKNAPISSTYKRRTCQITFLWKNFVSCFSYD